MKKIAFALAAVGMAGAATTITTAPAFAETGAETVSINPSAYNVGSAAGYRELSERIERAASRVCGTVQTTNLREAAHIRQCRADAVAAATSQLNRLAAAQSETMAATR